MSYSDAVETLKPWRRKCNRDIQPAMWGGMLFALGPFMRLAILDRTARATGWKTPAASCVSLMRCKSGSYLGEDDIERFDDVYGRRNSRANPG